jgi:hypothetical protein
MGNEKIAQTGQLPLKNVGCSIKVWYWYFWNRKNKAAGAGMFVL